MRKRLLKNWGLKLISLILAFFLWFVVVKAANPTQTVTFNNVPVKLVNTELLDQQNKVYEVLENTDTVKVRISAPRNIADNLRTSDIVAKADIGKLTDINTVAITYDVGYEVYEVKGDHDVVRLNVEDKRTKWIKLQANPIGEVAEGYMMAGATLDQTLLEVSGPASLVNQISYAAANIDVTDATNKQSATVEVQLFDSEGNVLDFPSIKKNVDYVYMTVDVLAVKEVPIELNVTGEPAEGYLATGDVRAERETVQIAGTTAALAGVNAISIPEEKIDLTGATGNVEEIINLKEYLPSNIRLAESGFNGRIAVTVFVEPIVEREILVPAENIVLVGQPAGVDVKILEPEEPYTLLVSGLAAHVNPLLAGNITGTVDVAAWMAEHEKEKLTQGIYEIPITFSLSDNIHVKEKVYARVAATEEEE